MFSIIKGLVAFAVLTLLVLGGILLVVFWFSETAKARIRALREAEKDHLELSEAIDAEIAKHRSAESISPDKSSQTTHVRSADGPTA